MFLHGIFQKLQFYQNRNGLGLPRDTENIPAMSQECLQPVG